MATNPDKPIVFLSHSTQDRDRMIALNALLDSRFGKAVIFSCHRTGKASGWARTGLRISDIEIIGPEHLAYDRGMRFRLNQGTLDIEFDKAVINFPKLEQWEINILLTLLFQTGSF